MMFGYACSETPELMPAPIFYAHAILRSLSEARHAGKTPLLGPDAKSQVTLQYVDGKPVRATKVVDRKSTRLNSSHSQISYAVFCLKKKKEAESTGARREETYFFHPRPKPVVDPTPPHRSGSAAPGSRVSVSMRGRALAQSAIVGPR